MTVQVLVGDVRERLAEIPDATFDCVVTSPPYWGLRDYGVEGQIGLEPTLGEHLAVMVEVMREVRRVMKPAGTLWLNYGDCYATAPNGRSAADTKLLSDDDRTFRDKPFSTVGPIYNPNGSQVPQTKSHRGSAEIKGRVEAGGWLKPKDLCMVPNRLAIALQEDGWWVRSEIIWAKPNPMPESITDRPATSHEKIWLLTKAPRYFYDAEAVAVPGATTEEQANSKWRTRREKRGKGQQEGVYHGSTDSVPFGNWKETRNLRNYEPAPLEVWPIATQPFKEAHFATFPPELALRCLTAGCPKGGRVLDPFGGAGTVGLVSDRLGLDCTLIELNPAYATLARNRIADDAGLFAEVE